MIVEYDPAAQAIYVALAGDRDVEVAHTVGVTDLVMVDVDAEERVIGVEFAMPPRLVTDEVLGRLVDRFPECKPLLEDHSWLMSVSGS